MFDPLNRKCSGMVGDDQEWRPTGRASVVVSDPFVHESWSNEESAQSRAGDAQRRSPVGCGDVYESHHRVYDEERLLQVSSKYLRE